MAPDGAVRASARHAVPPRIYGVDVIGDDDRTGERGADPGLGPRPAAERVQHAP